MNRGTLWYRMVRCFVRNIVLNILGGVRVIGREHEPFEGPVIVAPVHMSYLDPPVVACAMQRAITFMAKEELFVSVLAPLIKSLGAFKVKRGAGDTEAIRIAIKLLQEGRAVLMFPEGTRGYGETLGPMTPGVAMLAKKTGAKVFPVGLVGLHKVWPKGQKKLRRAKMTVVFGAPFTYADVCGSEGDKNSRQRFNDELEKRLVELCHQGGLPVKSAPQTMPQEVSADPAPSTVV